MDLKEMG